MTLKRIAGKLQNGVFDMRVELALQAAAEGMEVGKSGCVNVQDP